MKMTRLKVWAFGTIIFILFYSFSMYSFSKERNREKLPELRKINAFNLLDASAEQFSSKDKLDGRVWIASFIFTTCSDVCPIMTKNLAKLDRTFAQVRGIKIVSFSVNPEYDTPEVLKQYADNLDADPDHWYFLTGKREDIRDIIVNSFKLGSIDEPIFHSSYFSLVDRNGYLRGHYDGTNTEDINTLFKDAARLLRER